MSSRPAIRSGRSRPHGTRATHERRSGASSSTTTSRRRASALVRYWCSRDIAEPPTPERRAGLEAGLPGRGCQPVAARGFPCCSIRERPWRWRWPRPSGVAAPDPESAGRLDATMRPALVAGHGAEQGEPRFDLAAAAHAAPCRRRLLESPCESLADRLQRVPTHCPHVTERTVTIRADAGPSRRLCERTAKDRSRAHRAVCRRDILDGARRRVVLPPRFEVLDTAS